MLLPTALTVPAQVLAHLVGQLFGRSGADASTLSTAQETSRTLARMTAEQIVWRFDCRRRTNQDPTIGAEPMFSAPLSAVVSTRDSSGADARKKIGASLIRSSTQLLYILPECLKGFRDHARDVLMNQNAHASTVRELYRRNLLLSNLSSIIEGATMSSRERNGYSDRRSSTVSPFVSP